MRSTGTGPAEFLLGAKVYCAMGVAPPLRWLRGLELHAQMHPTTLQAHAEVLMDTKVTLQPPPE